MFAMQTVHPLHGHLSNNITVSPAHVKKMADASDDPTVNSFQSIPCLGGRVVLQLSRISLAQNAKAHQITQFSTTSHWKSLLLGLY